ncbi:MAG: DUF697 domain-containing protein [Deltaproteobacteria bacterium]|nr:DUF697 domain-containing protein [Deltaproteobacteria bacterium]
MTERASSSPGRTDRHGRTDAGDLFALIERLPFVGTAAKELAHLRALLIDRRAPRILAIGARGSGKTSLVNALLGAEVLPALPQGEPTDPKPSEGAAEPVVSGEGEDGLPLGIPIAHGSWVRMATRGRQLAWLELDARKERSRETSRSLENAMEEHAPDLVLVVLHAERLEDELPHVAAALKELFDLLGSRGATPRVLVVLNAADALCKPAEFARPPYPTDAMDRIDRATLRAKTALEAARPLPSGVEIGRAIPCASSPDPSRRWNLGEVADALFTRLPEATKVEAARALPVDDAHVRDVARKVVLHFASIAVVVGLMPIPFSDAVALLPTQALMVTAVAYVAGQPWDRRAAMEWVGSLGVMGGTAVGLRWSAQQLLKLWPGGGTLISASVAGVGTEALGLSAIKYFVDGPGRRGRRAPTIS